MNLHSFMFILILGTFLTRISLSLKKSVKVEETNTLMTFHPDDC